MENEFENENKRENMEDSLEDRTQNIDIPYGNDYNRDNQIGNDNSKTASPTENSHNSSSPTENSHNSSNPTENSHNSSNPTENGYNSSNPTENSHNSSNSTENGYNSSNPTENSHNSSSPTENGYNSPNQNGNNYAAGNQTGGYGQQPYHSNGPTYTAPDYHYDRNQGFHNEYQERNNGYSSGHNGKKGGTAKKVAIIAGCAVMLGVVAAVGFKGVDILLNTTLETNDLIGEKEQSAKEEQAASGNTTENTAGNETTTEDSSGEGTSVEKTTVGSASDGESIVSDIAEEVMKSMVSIDCTITETYSDYFGRNYSQDETGSGSGFVIGESDTELFIATNNHVVEGANEITVAFIDETKATATTKGTDSSADLAVVSVQKSDLKKSTLKAIKIASMGDSDEVRLGERVVAIGNALGYGQSVTVGYISAKDREVELDDNEKMVLLQTDAAINPGNSGGALINLQGEVIGIPTVKYADSTVEGMGFAIPISRATPILDELMKREVLTEDEQGYLGVSCLDVTSDATTMYGIPIGVYISEVSDDGAAKEAGIQVGDIITAINGVETTSKEAFIEKIHSYRIGTEITITLQRSSNGKYKEMEVTAKLKGASTIDGLSGSDDTDTDTSDDSSNGNNGNSGSNGSNGSNGSSGNDSNDYYYYYGDNGTDDFNNFFGDFFN